MNIRKAHKMTHPIFIIFLLALSFANDFLPQALATTWVDHNTKPAINHPNIQRVNLNTAAVKDLIKLPGIGNKKAAAIIEFRQQNELKNIEDLNQIKGFNDTLIEKIRPYLYIE